MNRFHVHLNVVDHAESVRFYTQLFGAAPSVLKSDYAKWMLDDPRINFAISCAGRAPGIDHLGVQVNSADELVALGRRLEETASTVVPEPDATCCYARSDKQWAEDPQGTRWEIFHTFGEATTYHRDAAACAATAPACMPAVTAEIKPAQTASSCCAASACC